MIETSNQLPVLNSAQQIVFIRMRVRDNHYPCLPKITLSTSKSGVREGTRILTPYLNTPDEAIAQRRAVERYKYVVAQGWELDCRCPHEISRVRPLSLRSYKQALRRLAAESVLKIDHSPKEHAKWQTAVEAVPLTSFTGDVLAKCTKRRMDFYS